MLYHCSKQLKNIENLLIIEQDILISFCSSLCLLRHVLSLPFSTADIFHFLDTVLCEILNVTSDHSFRCIKKHVCNNYNLRYFVSLIIDSLYKSFSIKIEFLINLLINPSKVKLEFLRDSSVQISLKLNQIFLEILQPFSEAATREDPYKKLFLKIPPYSQENICGGVYFPIECRPSSLQLY